MVAAESPPHLDFYYTAGTPPESSEPCSEPMRAVTKLGLALRMPRGTSPQNGADVLDEASQGESTLLPDPVGFMALSC